MSNTIECPYICDSLMNCCILDSSLKGVVTKIKGEKEREEKRTELLSPSEEDVQFMVKASQGDRAAYSFLYEKYFYFSTAFLFIAQHKLYSSPDDLTQEVFCHVWEHRKRYKPGSAINSYFISFAMNIVREAKSTIRRRIALRTNYLPRKCFYKFAQDFLIECRDMIACEQLAIDKLP